MEELSLEDFKNEKQLEPYLNDENINCKLKYGYTPTMIAVYRGWYDTIQKIIQLENDGTEVLWFAINDFGDNTLMIASQQNCISIFNILLNIYLNEGTINWVNFSGYSSLMIASFNGNEYIVRKLIEAKADVNIRDKNNVTALELALTKGHRDIAKRLIINGAICNGNDEHLNSIKGDFIMPKGLTIPPKPQPIEPNEDLKHFTREFTFLSLSNTELHPYRLEKGVEIWSREKQSEFIESCMLNKNFEKINPIIIQIEKEQNEGKYQLSSAEEYIFKMSGHYSDIPIDKEENTQTYKQKYYVMDGFQRILAINDFINNIYVLTNLKRLKNLNGVRFDKLTIDERKTFLNKNLRAVCFGNIADWIGD